MQSLTLLFQECDLIKATQQIRSLSENPPHLAKYALQVKNLQMKLESQEKFIPKSESLESAQGPRVPESGTNRSLHVSHAFVPVTASQVITDSMSPQELSGELQSLQSAFARIFASQAAENPA
jgi:hypothetical protein